MNTTTTIYRTGERVRVTFDGEVRDVDHAGYLTVNVSSDTAADRIAVPLDVNTIRIERVAPDVERGVLYRCVLGQIALGVELDDGAMAVCWPDGSISPVSELGETSLPLEQVWPVPAAAPESEPEDDDEYGEVEDETTHRSGVSAAGALRLLADRLDQLGTARQSNFYLDVHFQVEKGVTHDEDARSATVRQLADALGLTAEVKAVSHGHHLVARGQPDGVRAEATAFTALDDTDSFAAVAEAEPPEQSAAVS